MDSSKNFDYSESHSAVLNKVNDHEDNSWGQEDFISRKKHEVHKSSYSDNLDNNKSWNNGRWSDFEHLIFLACIIEFGKDWKKTETYVQTRTSCQVRSHAQKVLRKLEKSSILKEISELKQKISFQPDEHQLKGLSILNTSVSNSNQRVKVSLKYQFWIVINLIELNFAIILFHLSQKIIKELFSEYQKIKNQYKT